MTATNSPVLLVRVRSVTYLVVLLALAGVMIATLGQAGTASLVYVAVAAVMIFPLRWPG